MKKFIIICIFFAAATGYSQDKQPTYTVEENLVKATYYYDNGAVSTQGFFKNKKLTGEWTRFDKEGNKIQLAYYDSGKKIGKWIVFSSESIKEIDYKNNAIANVNVIEKKTKLAIHK